jgi:PIN like domain
MTTVFIDRSIPRSVGVALQAVRSDVALLDEHFPRATPDEVWLAEVGRRGWLVILRDKNIRTRPGERRAILDNRVGGFCLTQKRDPNRWEYLKLLCQTLEEMLRLFAATPRPFLFGVDQGGTFKLMTPPHPSSTGRVLRHPGSGSQRAPGGP